MAARNEGLRARKKRATRDAIATAARALFTERGFDAVPVAAIAIAADVSEKTVFNHFATKEDLAFAGREERLDRLLTDLTERAPGTTVIEVFRATTATMLDELAAGTDDDFVALPLIIRNSKSLQERLTLGWETESSALTAAITEPDADPLIPSIIARSLSWTHRTIFSTALTALTAGENREALATRLHIAADAAYDQLAAGLGDYGRR
jgi:AcrR family transcriptional regulator